MPPQRRSRPESISDEPRQVPAMSAINAIPVTTQANWRGRIAWFLPTFLDATGHPRFLLRAAFRKVPTTAESLANSCGRSGRRLDRGRAPMPPRVRQHPGRTNPMQRAVMGSLAAGTLVSLLLGLPWTAKGCDESGSGNRHPRFRAVRHVRVVRPVTWAVVPVGRIAVPVDRRIVSVIRVNGPEPEPTVC